MIAQDRAELAEATALKLLEYCRANDWAGYDPYDALNSRIFNAVPFLDFRLPRLCLTQALKRLPLNLRPLLLVPKTQNPKGLALFLSATLKLSKLGLADRDIVTQLAEKLLASRSSSQSRWCWGYSFPWQTRTVLVPRGSPNIVCTTFAANALLDLFEAGGDSRYLDVARSAADYLCEELFWSEGDSVASFSYPLAGLRTRVHNANFLGAAFLGRVHALSPNPNYLESALKVTRYSIGKQRRDGSWDYGESNTQSWVDNFHTGFNLCALRTVGQTCDTDEFQDATSRGFSFYRDNFFLRDGAPKYFHNRAYPFDIHSAAQSIITMVTFKDSDPGNAPLAWAVCQWTLQNLRNERGFFYFQKHRYYTNKIDYARWSQAWMLLALTTMLEGFQ